MHLSIAINLLKHANNAIESNWNILIDVQMKWKTIPIALLFSAMNQSAAAMWCSEWFPYEICVIKTEMPKSISVLRTPARVERPTKIENGLKAQHSVLSAWKCVYFAMLHIISVPLHTFLSCEWLRMQFSMSFVHSFSYFNVFILVLCSFHFEICAALRGKVSIYYKWTPNYMLHKRDPNKFVFVFMKSVAF